jgi:outer membrane PBP1 activator LpoA protein
MIVNKIIWFFLTVLACMAITGCASTNGFNGNSKGAAQQTALHQAKQLMRMAENASEQQNINYKLQAVEQLIAADSIVDAAKSLNEDFNSSKLDTNNTHYKQILSAQLDLAKQDLTSAKLSLREIWTPTKLPENLQLKFYATRAEVYRRSGNTLDAVRDRVFLGRYLNSEEDQKANNKLIWDMLTQITPSTLKTLNLDKHKSDLNGWLEFAVITKQYDASPEQLMRALASWRVQYPNHQAINLMPDYADKLQQFTAIPESKIVTAPQRIALLLPLQGQHAKSAQAIRDGFFAAYYAHKEHNGKTAILVYDTSAHNNLSGVYEQAIADGAEFIVGPLTKEEVDSISTNVRPQVPVLALNSPSRGGTQHNILQFGLSPEMEAQAVAQKAWADGHRNAMVIIPKSAWGKRMLSAFQNSWQELGGRVFAVEEIDSQTNLTKGIKRLLDIDSSEARAQKLKQLGIKFTYDQRRRQDVDMVFIATNAALARQVKPLLNYYFANNLPAYASSSIFTGKLQPNLDRDLNGIQFCDMPWILDQSLIAKNTQKTVAELWPQDFDQYSRLYALGLDAYKISQQIERLTMMPDLGVSGVTGMLTLDQQAINRKLIWASFKKGVPQINGEY